MHTAMSALGLGKMNAGVFDGSWHGAGPVEDVITPVDGELLGHVREGSATNYDDAVSHAQDAFLRWRTTPAPLRGELVRRFGLLLRDHKTQLGKLVAWETGKILDEAEGEVQEMIDVCDFAVGLSRQLHGLTIASERPQHRLMEQWHPLGTIGVITAFNFPVAVWAWNAALACVCGDAVVWKPSSLTPLCAIAVTRLAEQACRQAGVSPALFTLVCGTARPIGRCMARDRRLPLISATGSCAMGRRLARTVQTRLGRTLLELGGNNAVIITPSASLDLALRAVVFGAIGTAGQRCTSTRRVYVHESIMNAFRSRLRDAYSSLRIGSPLDRSTVMGPLVNRDAAVHYLDAVQQAKHQGGTVVQGGTPLDMPGGCYVTPCLMECGPDLPLLRTETFGPLLYLIPYHHYAEAIAWQNDVPQGLSSAVFTRDFVEAEMFVGPAGSDCGLANVNTGTSGAEIGGAFGGEKDTGGGRESGSDAWKNYMRRQTNTINYGTTLPLAQGIHFGGS